MVRVAWHLLAGHLSQANAATVAAVRGPVQTHPLSLLPAPGTADSQLFNWGWRCPFLLSLVGAAVGVYVSARRDASMQRMRGHDDVVHDPRHVAPQIRRQLHEPRRLKGHHAHGGGSIKVLLSVGTVFVLDFITAIGESLCFR